MDKLTNDAGFTQQVRSKERVRALAEVFTADREVMAMLDLLGDISAKITARYLEPSCGNGNFLVAILKRKLATIFSLKPTQREFEFLTLQSLASLYGIDISPENIDQARERLRVQVIETYSERLNTLKMTDGFLPALDHILSLNVQVGDMINGVDRIYCTEFTTPKPNHFAKTTYKMSDLLRRSDPSAPTPMPMSRTQAMPYWRIA